jgi:hypothetical protein
LNISRSNIFLKPFIFFILNLTASPLIYHLKKNDIIKGEAVKFRMKNIKGLRKIFERDMFKLEKLKEGEEK